MKKALIFFMLCIMMFCYSRQLSGKSTDKFLIKKPTPLAYKAFTEENSKEKYTQLLWLKQQTEKLRDKYLSSSTFKHVTCDNALQGKIKLLPESVYMQAGENGNIYATGVCQNVNEPQAAIIFITLEYFNAGGTSLGYSLGMVFGESTIQVPTEEAILCFSAMHPGEKGFFMDQSVDIKYADVDTYTATFYYGVPEEGLIPLADAKLSIESVEYLTWGGNKLRAHATVKNSSTTHGSTTTVVILAMYDTTNTQLIDGAGSIAGSPSSPGYNWAIYPSSSETVDIHCRYMDVDQPGTRYLSSFMFYQFELNQSDEHNAPFGSFDTPGSGPAVSGSIAVTGWALDDVCLKSLAIYRKEGAGKVYIGDACFLEGARPDVATTYPDYPNSSKAGWGYMLLTNFLPNGGNGTYTLYAIATDWKGKSTTLGEKTFICDNANAVKPFGALDTPPQGGGAATTTYPNWGWVLTPPADYLPIDGSTILLYIDGTKLPGHVTYNLPRSDIEEYFKEGGYLNLKDAMTGVKGPCGNYTIDTTAYEDGVHTIQWVATDSGGDSDGIGSRYFMVINHVFELGDSISAGSSSRENNVDLLPINARDTIFITKGFDQREPETPGTRVNASQGIYRVEKDEMDMIQLTLSGENTVKAGYLLVGEQLRKLPIGSTLDREHGIFSWMPGPGFVGEYRLVFIEEGPDGQQYRKDIIIRIVPGGVTQTR